MPKDKEPKWRKWNMDYELMSDEDWKETCAVMAECLPAAINRHEKENNA